MDQQIEAKSLDAEGVIDGQEKGEEDLTPHMVTPFVGMVFSSEEDVYEFFQSYARQTGFGVCKKSKKNDDDGQQRYYSLACNKSGNGKVNGKSIMSAKRSTKTSCKAKINVRVSNGGSFIISKVCLDHNHALGPKVRYREYSEEKMRFYKLCSQFHILAEIGAESQENYDFLLKWIDEVQAKLMNKFASKTIDVDNVGVELESEVEKGNQHVSFTILPSPLEEQAEGRLPIKRKQSMAENVVEKKKRSKKEVIQEQQHKQSENVQPLNMIKEPSSVATDQVEKAGQQIEAIDVEGVIDGQEKVEGTINSHSSTPCVGMIFSSEIEVHEFYKSYARQTGFGICKKSKRNDDDGQQRYYSLACHKFGNRKINGKIPLRVKSSIKTGCKAKVNVRVSDEGSYIISKVCLDHNHPLIPNMRCGEYDDEEDETMVEKKKSSKQKAVEEQQNEQSQDVLLLENAEIAPSGVTDQRGETSTTLMISPEQCLTSTLVAEPASDPTALSRSTHTTPLTPPPHPDMETMAAQINALQTQLSNLTELMTSRLPPSQPPPTPVPVPFPQWHPMYYPNMPVAGRAVSHPPPQPGVSEGNSVPGPVRPTSHSLPASFYLNFETNNQ